jgi:hypothetical protein
MNISKIRISLIITLRVLTLLSENAIYRQMRNILFLVTLSIIISCHENGSNRTINFPKSVEIADKIPDRYHVWVFILAGQSNMAGRAFVEPMDTLPDKRILTIDKEGRLIYAKEPLHFYEPNLTGLDCGLSFGKTLIKSIPDSISILLIPTAVGGSSVEQWIGDSTHRSVKLLTNFRDKVGIAKKYGHIKGILWHQGENDANPNNIPQYKSNLTLLFKTFRTITGNESLPILIGELGSFSSDHENWSLINEQIKEYANIDSNTAIISTSDFQDIGDKVHFNSAGQRIMGQRMADEFINKFK